MRPCPECPHAGQVPLITVGFLNHPQPCHMLPEQPCQGHCIHLQMIQDGVLPATDPVLTFNVSGSQQTENHYLMKALRERWLESGAYKERTNEAAKHQADEFRTYGSENQSKLDNPSNLERCQ